MRYLFLFVFVHCCLFLFAFTPRSIQVKGESYFVFPYPVEHSSLAIPPYPEKLPDGNYLGYSKTVRYYGFSIWKMKRVVKTIDSTLSVSFGLNNQLPDGKATFYQTNKKVYATGQFNKGLKDGEWKIYRENKLDKILLYRNGKKQGAQKTFFENGKLKRNEHYEDNERSGKFFEYLPNGKLKEEGEFVKGHLVLSKKYYTNGNLSSTSVYKDTIIENDSILNLLEIPGFNFYVPRNEYSRAFSKCEYISYKENGRVYFSEHIVKNKTIAITFGTDEKGNPYGKLTKLDPDSLPRNARYELEWRDEKGVTYVHRSCLSNPNYSFELSLAPNGDTIRYSSTIEKILEPEGYHFYQRIEHNQTEKTAVNIYKHFETDWIHNDITTNKIYNENGVWKRKITERSMDGLVERNIWYSQIPMVFTSSNSFESYYSEPDTKWIGSNTKTDSAFYTLNGKPLEGEVNFRLGKKNRIRHKNGITTIENKASVWNISELILAKGNFEQGVKTGLWEYHFSNGNEIHCSYQQGKLNGSYLVIYCKNKWDEEELDLARSCGIENKKHKYPRIHVSLKNGFTHGDAVVLDFTGSVLINAGFENGNLHGKLEVANILGRNLIKANYRHGELNGVFYGEKIQYNAEDIHLAKNHEKSMPITVKCNYEDGVLNGHFQFLINNDTVISGIVKKNLAVGEWKVLHHFDKHSGLLHFSTELHEKDSLNLQNVIFWLYDGYVEDEIFVPSDINQLTIALKKHGNIKVYDINGNLVTENKYPGGKRLSSETYYPSGKLSQRLEYLPQNSRMHTFDDSYLPGNITTYYENGQIHSVGKYKYLRSEFDCEKGIFIEIPVEIEYSQQYDPDGKATVVNGNGYCKETDYRKFLRAEGEMLNHQRNGQWKIYDNNGKLSAIGNYVNGKKNGFWISGDLTGMNSLSNYCLDENNPELKAFLEKELANLNFTVEYFEMGKSVQYQSTHVDTYEYIWPSKKMYKKRSLYSDEF